MAITASLVRELRERTGVGMMECKKALSESNADVEQAIELLRKAGQAKAAKKASRVAAEGIIKIVGSDDQHAAVMLEINSETDFVARDESFLAFCQQVGERALQAKATSTEVLSGVAFVAGESKTIEQARQELITKIGENISIRHISYVSSQNTVASYSHGGRIGVLVELKSGDAALARDIAMHIAASRPLVVSANEVPAELIEKEREIFTAQAQDSGKPAEIIAKMVDGRIKKYVAEVSLHGQSFVKDPSTTVSKLLEQNNAEVISFYRMEVGEGIEKEETDFVQEVMAQVRGE